ncbi:hypothetical protein V8F20_003970 [Naviculisporaceae sp. PSN 640]
MSSAGTGKAVIPDLTPIPREALRRGCPPLHVPMELVLPLACRPDGRPPARPRHRRSHSTPLPSRAPIELRPAPARDQTEAQPQHLTTTASSDWPTFFPEAKRQIIQAFVAHHVGLSPSLLNLPKPRCPICHESLSLAGFDANPDLEPAMVIGCGHLIGEYCLREYVDRVVHNADQYIECPECRFSFLDLRGCPRHRLVAVQHLSPLITGSTNNQQARTEQASDGRQKVATLSDEEWFPLNENFHTSLANLSRE